MSYERENEIKLKFWGKVIGANIDLKSIIKI